MIRYTKKTILSVLDNFIKFRWANNRKPKILIRVSKYFTSDSWESAISISGNINRNDYNIVYCSNKLSFKKHFPDADFCFVYSYDRSFNDYGDKPKLIFIATLGMDSVNSKQIPSTYSITTPNPHSAYAIAEYCLSTAIVMLRNLQIALFNQHNKIWDQNGILEKPFKSLKTHVIGVLGVGRVGNRIAEIFNNFGCKVIGYDIKEDLNNISIEKWFIDGQLSLFLSQVEILIISIPLTDQTRGLIDKHALASLRNNAILINISRGDIVVEKDLIRALENGTIAGAVLDTFSVEPLPSRSKFYKLRNTIVTPHVAGNINLFISEIQNDFLKKISEINFL